MLFSILACHVKHSILNKLNDNLIQNQLVVNLNKNTFPFFWHFCLLSQTLCLVYVGFSLLRFWSLVLKINLFTFNLQSLFDLKGPRWCPCKVKIHNTSQPHRTLQSQYSKVNKSIHVTKTDHFWHITHMPTSAGAPLGKDCQ